MVQEFVSYGSNAAYEQLSSFGSPMMYIPIIMIGGILLLIGLIIGVKRIW